MIGLGMKEASTSFFEKKAAKKLFLIGPAAVATAGPNSKSFLVTFFQKSNCLLFSSRVATKLWNPGSAS
jgi:hypothetical protein